MHIYISLPPSPSPSLFPYHRRKHLSLNATRIQQLLGECDIGIKLVQGCSWLCHSQAEWFRQGTWHGHESVFLSLKWGTLVVSINRFVVWIKWVDIYKSYRTVPGHSKQTTNLEAVMMMLQPLLILLLECCPMSHDTVTHSDGRMWEL